MFAFVASVTDGIPAHPKSRHKHSPAWRAVRFGSVRGEERKSRANHGGYRIYRIFIFKSFYSRESSCMSSSSAGTECRLGEMRG